MYVVIAGGGKIGSYLTKTMIDNNHDVAIIEKDESVCEFLSEFIEGRFLLINGDCCELSILQDAGINRADVFVASTGQDETNLVACELADQLYDVPRVIARVNSPRNLRIFRELGIECVSTTNLIGSLILEEALHGSVSITSTLTHGDIILSEYSIPHKKSLSGEGVKLGDIELPEGARWVAVETEEGPEIGNDDYVLFPGDQVIVVSDRSLIPQVRLAFSSLG